MSEHNTRAVEMPLSDLLKFNVKLEVLFDEATFLCLVVTIY